MRILNRPTRITLNLAVIGVVSLVAIGMARADTIETQTLSAPSAATNWNYTYYFNPFNPVLGTLQSVTVKSQGTLDDYVLTATNNDGAGETINNLSATFQTNLSGPGNLTTVSETSIAGPFIFSSFTLGLGASKSFTISPTSGGPVTGNPVSETFTTSLTPYESSSQVVFNGSASAGYSASADSNVKISAMTDASQSVTLIYDYIPNSPSPEPLSMSLSGAGLVLLSLIGRRRLVRNR